MSMCINGVELTVFYDEECGVNKGYVVGVHDEDVIADLAERMDNDFGVQVIF